MKGTDRFIKIAKRMPDHKFRIVGYGKEEWDDDIPANVTVSGHLSPKECYQEASLWLSPSRFDSFGMTVIEAQLNNIPTIATNICAVKEDETVMLGSTIDDGDDIDEWIEKISYWNKKVDTIKPSRSMLEKFVTTESGATLIKIIENLT
jgi:glycosyltransferase involved in cell wall biosynthesis